MSIPVPSKIEDHDDKAIARLTGFTLESPNVQRLVRALTVGTQNIEDVLDDLINKQAISTAEGVQLDNLGTILDLERIPGQSDVSYRTSLLGRAAGLASQSGTAEQLIQIYLLLLDADSVVSIDLQIATFEMTAVGTDDGSPSDSEVISSMGNAKSAGVQLILQIGIAPLFLWGDESDVDGSGDLPATATGWGDEADADANGDILPGVGGGNFVRAL